MRRTVTNTDVLELKRGVRHASKEVMVRDGLPGTHFGMNTEQSPLQDRQVMGILTESERLCNYIH